MLDQETACLIVQSPNFFGEVEDLTGLADTVQLFNPRTGRGTGFPFEQHDATGLTWAIETALKVYKDPALWRRLMLNGMAQNFSWEAQAKQYEALYGRLARLGA